MLVLASFVWQGHYGFSISDEGFLWYGVQRVQAGEVPILDFMAYDPGRYYWAAALMGVLRDDGIIALRIAVASFQMLGLFVALLLLLRDKSKPDAILFTLAAITLLTWMFPRYKLFDISLSMMLIGILTLVAQRPSRRVFFLAGAGVGLIAIFGRNHGVYGIVGTLTLLIFLACRRPNPITLFARLAWWSCGVVVGYLPMLVLAVVVPGFAAAFWDDIRAILQQGTNLPLPGPWPWLVPVTQLPPSTAIAGVLAGMFFIAILGFAILSILWIIRRALRRQPAAPELVACAALAVPYAHFAFSRADVPHLAQGIFPFLIGVFIVLRAWPNRARWLVAFVIAGASLLVMLPRHPGWSCRVIQPCVSAEVAANALTVEPEIGGALAMLRSVTGEYAPDGRSFMVAPFWPGAYAVFKRRSPVWEIYALFPQGEEFQRREIERMKAARPGFVLILDLALDGRDDRRFRNTHALIEQYVRDNFDPVAISNESPRVVQFYKSR